jgi:hypothetical protein
MLQNSIKILQRNATQRNATQRNATQRNGIFIPSFRHFIYS